MSGARTGGRQLPLRRNSWELPPSRALRHEKICIIPRYSYTHGMTETKLTRHVPVTHHTVGTSLPTTVIVHIGLMKQPPRSAKLIQPVHPANGGAVVLPSLTTAIAGPPLAFRVRRRGAVAGQPPGTSSHRGRRHWGTRACEKSPR